jgi:formate hydrogenlyase subunit 6/NADH:ubiquinone oxidoreductase subunit I
MTSWETIRFKKDSANAVRKTSKDLIRTAATNKYPRKYRVIKRLRAPYDYSTESYQ